MNKRFYNNLILVTSITLLVHIPLYCYGAQEYELESQNKVEVKISKNDQNRIATLNDRILQVYATNEKFHYDVDEGQGQLFIKPKSLSDQAFTISLVTEKGRTVDLKLIPTDSEAQTVILKLNDTKDQDQKEDDVHAEEEAEITAMVNSALLEKDIKGFVKVEFRESEQGSFKESEQGKKNLSYYTDQLNGFVTKIKYTNLKTKKAVRVFNYKNLKSQNDEINEKQFYFSKNVIAVFVEKRSLEAGQTTKVVVIENE